MISKYCVDTHALIWYFLGKKNLGITAESIIKKGFQKKVTLIIPTIVVLEVFHLSLKDPHVRFPAFLSKLMEAQCIIVPFDKQDLQTVLNYQQI